MSECIHHYRRDVESCPYCELNEAEAEVRRLQDILKRYGEHEQSCRWRDGARWGCSCGLASELGETKD